MGEDGAKRVVVNSTGREISALEEDPADRRPPRPVDGRLRPAEGGRRRVPSRRLQRRRADHGSAQRRGADLHQPALVRSQRLRGGIDRATWASLNTDKLRPLQNRVLQGRYSPGSTFKIVVATAALEEGLVTPDHRMHLRRRRDLLRPLLQVPLEGAATARSTCGTRSRSPATSTSTRSATCSAWTRSTSGRRSSAWPARPASICRTSRRASFRTPSGS